MPHKLVSLQKKITINHQSKSSTTNFLNKLINTKSNKRFTKRKGADANTVPKMKNDCAHGSHLATFTGFLSLLLQYKLPSMDSKKFSDEKFAHLVHVYLQIDKNN